MESRLRAKFPFRTFLTIALAFWLVVEAAPLPLSMPSQLICTPATWQTVILFFLLNYGVHAFTVKSFPGETGYTTAGWMLAALLLPFSGITKGCFCIAGAKVPGESDLHHAHRTRALCTVIRTEDWKPRPGEDIPGCVIRDLRSSSPGTLVKSRLEVVENSEPSHGLFVVFDIWPEADNIHGQIVMPPGGGLWIPNRSSRGFCVSTF